MAGVRPELRLRDTLNALFLLLLSPLSAQEFCPGRSEATIQENNAVGAVVITIPTAAGVILSFPEGSNYPFSINGSQIIADISFDYETKADYEITFQCEMPETGEGSPSNLLLVFVSDVNDGAPVFPNRLYNVDINEFSEVVGSFPASDPDSPTLYYTLHSEPEGFGMQGPTSPNILALKPLDYDTIKSAKLILYAQDTDGPPPEGSASFTGTTTIMVSIRDIDNRPPWFQPCTTYNVDRTKVCQNAGYTGSVNETELAVGPLPLKPGPLRAIDGDSGINSGISYRFLNAPEGNPFEIDVNSGAITMLRAADVPGLIELTVLATQITNSFQLATTKVTIEVKIKSLHRPQFEKAQYSGLASTVGSMAMDSQEQDVPLRIRARDEDFASSGGVNPAITYRIQGSDRFSLIDGYLFMTKDGPPDVVSLRVEANDTTTGQGATVGVEVEVASGLSTSSVAPSTTDLIQTTTVDLTTDTQPNTNGTAIPTTQPSMTTLNSSLPTTNPSMTSHGSLPTTNPSMTTHGSLPTTNPSMTTHGSLPTTNPSMTTHGSLPTTNPSMTTHGSLPTTNPSMTTHGSLPTTNPSMTTHGSLPTTNPSMTTHGSLPTTNPSMTTHGSLPTTNPSMTTHGSLPTTNPSMTTHGSLPTTNPSLTTHGSLPTTNPSMTTHGSLPTTNTSITTHGSLPTTNPSTTTQDSISTASTACPPSGAGAYGPGDMAAVGVPLAVLLAISLVIIGILVCKIQKGKADWRKMTEASIFRSSLGRSPGELKEGVQYTNDAFQSDEDSGSTGSPAPVNVRDKPEPKIGDVLREEAILKSSAALLALLPDDKATTELSGADSEKEVKPILTKERRVEEGYKSVWFKEDIVPDAKDEVLIIPGNREQDPEEDEQEDDDGEDGSSTSGKEDDLEDKFGKQSPYLVNDSDSGLGMKILNPGSDSKYTEVMNSHL